MKEYQPPFDLTEFMLNTVSRISELVGSFSAVNHLSTNPTLRRQNRIKSIYSSLAIEQNTMTLEQVTAVLNGKRVLAPPKDIAEVKNAYEIYERLNELNPYSVDDLLLAHSIMTKGLIDESGMFRTKPVGVINDKGEVIHFGTLPQVVPDLVEQLFGWTENSELNMLIRSCVFHYEFELIHPFADGNGRIGRLWHTLLLSQWNPIFAWLPIESIIHDNQSKYYKAINKSNIDSKSTAFVEFMLSVIETALVEAVDNNATSKASKTITRQDLIIGFLKTHEYIMNADVRKLCDVSSATANRILNDILNKKIIKKCRIDGHWAYTLNSDEQRV